MHCTNHSIMTTGLGQEEVVVLQVELRIQEIIGEVALTGVAPGASPRHGQ